MTGTWRLGSYTSHWPVSRPLRGRYDHVESMWNPDVTPSYLPPGYKFRQRVSGESAGGFDHIPSQVALFHTIGWEREHFIFPLVVHIGPLDAPPLFGPPTERC